MSELRDMLAVVKYQMLILLVLENLSVIFLFALFFTIASGAVNESVLLFSLLGAVAILWAASLLVIGWAGYVFAKKNKSALDGGYAGGLISAISGLFSGFTGIVLIYPMIISSMQSVDGLGSILALGFGLGIPGIFSGIMLNAIKGFIIGGIGGMFGRKKKSKRKKMKDRQELKNMFD